MPDVSVFHQNMKNLSTGESPRPGLFKAKFKRLQQTLGRNYMVCGLTELLGNPQGLARLVPELTKCLDAKLDRAVIIAVGQTSSPKKVEYIGIAYDRTFFNLRGAGCILRKASSSDWVSFDKPSVNITRDRHGNGYIDMPPSSFGYKLDFRGVAYILAETNNNEWYIFGFMHNDFGNGDRSGSFRSLAYAAELIAGKANFDPEDIHIVFGGDFNVNPADIKGRSIEMTARFAQDNNGPIQTTRGRSGNVYDFWLLNGIMDFNAALTHDETQDGGILMSDHNGITLEFDY